MNTRKRIQIAVLGFAIALVISALGTLISRITSRGFCGDGPVTKWDVKPTAEQKDYVLLTVSNTNGGVQNNTVRATYMTSKGVLVGYAGELRDNLSFVTPTTIETCKSGETHIRGHVNSIYYDESRGEIWVATDGKGTYRYVGGQWKNYTTQDGLPHEDQYWIGLGPNSNIYVATWNGVATYDRTADKWLRVEELYSSLPQNHHTVLFAEPNDIWLGSIKGGILRKKGDKWITYRVDNVVGWEGLQVVPELKSNNIRTIVKAPDGRIWVGADPGLAIYDPKTDKWEDAEPCCKQGEFEALSIQFDTAGRAWVIGKAGTRVLGTTSDDAFWDSGLTLSVGKQNGVFNEETLIIGTGGKGLYIGATK